MRVLVVEDDVKLVRALQRGLTLEGYEVDIAQDGAGGLARASTEVYDVVVLDLMIPAPDGFAVCRALRAGDRWVPVLVLSARGEVADRIRALDEGADDYLVKPFDLGELLARLRVLVRRGPSPRPAAQRVGDLTVDPVTGGVTRGEVRLGLTARELDVLTVLSREPGRLVLRSALLAEVWCDGTPSANIADVYVGHLRRKLELAGSRVAIRTVRGRGFVLDLP